jgi:CTP:molybdopterin cytidylyltransferase MocA
MRTPTLIVFLGGFGSSDAERLVDEARTAATLDAVDAWRSALPQAPAIVVTDAEDLRADQPNVVIDCDGRDFNFGRRLADVLRRHKIERAVYMGGGSMPLFTAEDFARVAGGGATTNNLFSSDLIAFDVDDDVLGVVETIERDNSLARALKEKAGLDMHALERSVTTQFDIDTPTDLAVLSLTGEGGPRLRRQLAAQALEVERHRAVLPLFLEQTKQIVVAGRVGTHAWSYLERETACRVRLFAEERGMEADGRAASGEAHSLLGYHLEAVGLEHFFETLAQLGDAAFIDTRVLLAHKRIEASREDRFLSDLGHWQQISEPFLRDFTRAALEAPIPVLLGGHSLMAGGLMALNEYAWQTLGAS